MMTPFTAAVANMFLDTGVQLAPIVWLGVVVALGGCVAIVVATLHELFAERRKGPYSLTFGRAGVRRFAVAHLDRAA
jgi:hypothetical protein